MEVKSNNKKTMKVSDRTDNINLVKNDQESKSKDDEEVEKEIQSLINKNKNKQISNNLFKHYENSAFDYYNDNDPLNIGHLLDHNGTPLREIIKFNANEYIR